MYQANRPSVQARTIKEREAVTTKATLAGLVVGHIIVAIMFLGYGVGA